MSYKHSLIRCSHKPIGGPSVDITYVWDVNATDPLGVAVENHRRSAVRPVPVAGRIRHAWCRSQADLAPGTRRDRPKASCSTPTGSVGFNLKEIHQYHWWKYIGMLETWQFLSNLPTNPSPSAGPLEVTHAHEASSHVPGH